jgi:hypothetical protein
VSSLIKQIMPAADVVNELWAEYNAILDGFCK